jgi:phytoene dehydrogenase-like protein
MKKVIVVGAGIAGLTAAIYAQRSGFEVTLCEQHSIPGGMCTSWKRKGYLFEGAVHWLTGSSPQTELYQVWEETGALGDKVKIFLDNIFYSIEWEGKTFSLYRGIEKTAEQLLALSPADEKKIRRLVRDVKAASRLQMPITDINGVKAQDPKRMSLGMLFKMIPAFPVMAKLSKISCDNYLAQFEHPAIRKLFGRVPGNYAANSLIFTLATLNTGDGGYPEGGSLVMTGRMADTFKSLGGTLLLNTKVKKVIIKNGAVSDVMLENATLSADAVIVAQETVAALDQLFDTPPQDRWLSELRATTKPSLCTFIGIGVRAELPAIIPVWQLDEPITYAGKTVTELGFHSYARYAGYAPEGGCALTTAFMDDTYDFWKKAKEEGRYDEEKQKLAGQISRAFCKKFPQVLGNIEVIDIATPLTYERYTGAWRGSWMSVTGPGDKMKIYSGEAASVQGLYFAGHRLMPPGGLPVALDTGRRAAQLVCRRFGAVFR